jgi:N-acetylmuramoyl-L-alanine amidase
MTAPLLVLDRGLGLFASGLVLLALASCHSIHTPLQSSDTPLKGRVICVDPGHGGTAESDTFRVGPSGEREEWINLRVGLVLKELLEERGARVIMTRTEDVPVELADRARLAVENRVDAFVSIHHNATADSGVNFPIVYFHGSASKNLASVALGRIVASNLRSALFDSAAPACLVSDYAIFPGSGASVLRNSYGIPAVIGEASFFSNPDEEQRLKQPASNRAEARAYLVSLERFFSGDIPAIVEEDELGRLPPFPVLQEGGRMEEEARSWNELYQRGLELMQAQDHESLAEALDLFTRSAQAFPDSYVAQKCHQLRAEILAALGDEEEAEIERRRALEHYVAVN